MNGKITVICFLLLAMLLAACSRPEAEEKPADAGLAAAGTYDVDVIRLAGGDWGYPSPFAHYPRGPGGFKMCLIFDSLLERDEKGLIPWLAERYAVEDGGGPIAFSSAKGSAGRTASPSRRRMWPSPWITPTATPPPGPISSMPSRPWPWTTAMRCACGSRPPGPLCSTISDGPVSFPNISGRASNVPGNSPPRRR